MFMQLDSPEASGAVPAGAAPGAPEGGAQPGPADPRIKLDLAALQGRWRHSFQHLGMSEEPKRGVGKPTYSLYFPELIIP